MADETMTMLAFAAEYDELDDAKEDFKALHELHKMKWIGAYEAALFEKDEEGKVKIVETYSSPTRWGAVTGLVAGGLLGLIFPPTLLLMGAGAGAGALLGHLSAGMPRSDIKEMGDLLDEGNAGIVLIGQFTPDQGMDQLMKRAAKVAKKQVDADAEEMKKAIDEAAKG